VIRDNSARSQSSFRIFTKGKKSDIIDIKEKKDQGAERKKRENIQVM
jgi:hypothetical protein